MAAFKFKGKAMDFPHLCSRVFRQRRVSQCELGIQQNAGKGSAQLAAQHSLCRKHGIQLLAIIAMVPWL